MPTLMLREPQMALTPSKLLLARAYDVACTPDFSLFDADPMPIYRGRLDSSRPNSGIELTGCDLRAALQAVLAGWPVPPEQESGLGCNIRWKAGNGHC
jgi:hypothetical protein